MSENCLLAQYVAAGLLLFSCIVPAAQQSSPNVPSWVGDSLASPPPLATDLSPMLTRRDVSHAIKKVADWQLAKAQPGFDQDWTFAALYAGFMAVPREVSGNKYQDAMLQMGRKFQWQLGPRLQHADDQAIGQTYLDLYLRLRDPAMINPTRARMNESMRIPDDPAKPVWWWCDALFMAPPALARLYKATGDRTYLDYLDHEWRITSSLLYSPAEHLFFRDSSFLDKREANGAGIYWSRGNGWVFAGLARVLADMPADYPYRPRFIEQFTQMAEKLSALQGSDGLWRPGLLDPQAYTLPEVSGSAFYTYGFAYGINAGILDRKKYLPVVEKSWHGLLNHVYQDGRLGCIQPIGAAPGAYTATSSYVFGVGAFLLAGSEVYRLAR